MLMACASSWACSCLGGYAGPAAPSGGQHATCCFTEVWYLHMCHLSLNHVSVLTTESLRTSTVSNVYPPATGTLFILTGGALLAWQQEAGTHDGDIDLVEVRSKFGVFISPHCPHCIGTGREGPRALGGSSGGSARGGRGESGLPTMVPACSRSGRQAVAAAMAEARRVLRRP